MKHSVVSGAPKSRFVPMAWGAGALASVVMVLGVNGTLSSWTQAVINNDTNDTKSTVAVALEELSGATSCVDSATVAGNVATCSGINKYGDTVLDPDGTNTHSETVTMKNTGTAAGDLTVSADSCAATLTNGDPVSASMCGSATVKVTCGATPTTVFNTGTLDAFDTAGDKVVTNLDPAETINCTFLVTLPTNAPAQYSDQIASQPITWTLVAS
ncbi:hypothetical protein FB382_001327 [Nocardioides ginsengisegetis]|uniref:SipW-cognate class signal peptide n=1 Tax=Nocardioides ginsengisegetis TaxID=661491 RepID=A0A7W3P940_9ACTN|nr:hypothetical protein [Nocardioides ginsengisegetis]MBA8803036.1 hypothetical protein [Nocardioides ginsengisegetis]